MSVKFKIGFTIDAETLFGIIAKFLPVEDLEVEEIEPHAPKHVEKIARLVGPENRHEPVRPPRAKRPGPIPMSLDKGANAIIMNFLADGKRHGPGALKPLFRAAGYSDSGVASRLMKLKAAGVVHQPEYGLWQIGEAPVTKKSATG
jgi:hypothetical protein